MQTEELVIERLGEYIPLLKDVLNEYREELNYAYEDELLALLSDIKKSWTEGDLTGFSLKKICSILNSLQIDRLSDFKYTHPQLIVWSRITHFLTAFSHIVCFWIRHIIC